MVKQEKYILVGKTIFFPKEKILCIGDLHLGYEEMLKQQGLTIGLNLINKIIEDLNKIFDYLSENKYDIKKIILLGDIKHYFTYNKNEEKGFDKIMQFFDKKIGKRNIILIKGNHDTFNLNKQPMEDYYIFSDMTFLHGDKAFPAIYDKNINYIIMSHIHPTLILTDKMNIKQEKYKAFFIGKIKRQKVIVVPSFLPFVEGSNIEQINENKDFSIIPDKKLKNFDVYAISDEDLIARNFGKLKKFMKD